MKIDILTLFPEIIESYVNSSIIKRAMESERVTINIHDFRLFATNKTHHVDDYSYGGGAGMIIEFKPIVECLKTIDGFKDAHKILTSPVGSAYNQRKAEELSKLDHIIIICGHYEGIDDRISYYIDEKISIGDYILTGGEVASLAIIDSIIRLIPDVISKESTDVESFNDDLLEYPQYTRPIEYDGHKVPDVLISGNHENIRKWRRFMSLKITLENRPDLLDKANLTKEDLGFLKLIKEGKDLC